MQPDIYEAENCEGETVRGQLLVSVERPGRTAHFIFAESDDGVNDPWSPVLVRPKSLRKSQQWSE